MPPRDPKTPITVAELKDEELYGVVLQAAGEAQPFSDAAIQRRLIAAEDEYERDLQIRWQPTRVFSDVWGRQQGVFPANSLAKLPDDYDPLTDLDEPAYNYASDFWGDGRWGEMDLGWRPVRDITAVWFAFPGTNPIWQVPRTWIRPDRRFGAVQIVPSSAVAVYASFNAFILGVIAGGRGLPQSIFIDYVTGFADGELEQHHNDLLEGVRLRTMLQLLPMLSTAAAPGGTQGGSLGLDGLSRSRQFGPLGPYSAKIQQAIDREQEIRTNWKRKERGIPMAVLGTAA